MKTLFTILAMFCLLKVSAQNAPAMDTTANRYACRQYVTAALGSYIPTTRTITINGTTLDLSANRSWTTTVSAPTVLAKTANYTVLSGDFAVPTVYLTFDCTSGNLTCTLPTASSFSGYTVIVTKSDATANTLTISGLTGDNLIGTQKWTKQVISNGTTWSQQ